MSARRFGGIGRGGRIAWLCVDVIMVFIVFWPIFLAPFIADFTWGLPIFWVFCMIWALYLYWQLDIAVAAVIDEPMRQLRLLTYKSFLRRSTETIRFDQIDRIAWTEPAPAELSDEAAPLPVPQLHLRNGQIRPLTAHFTTSASSALDASRTAEAESLTQALATALKRSGSNVDRPSQSNARGF